MGENSPDPKPNRPWYQFNLRTVFVLTGITASFFSFAYTVGYVDATVSLIALTLLVCVMRYPRRVHPVTGVALLAVAAILLWANLRPTRWESEFDQYPPRELTLLTKGMFWRGWPVCPWMLCRMHHMFLDADDCPPGAALVLDGALFVIVLVAVKAACERCLRWRDKCMHPRGCAGHTGDSYGSAGKE